MGGGEGRLNRVTHYLPILRELDAWQAAARTAHPGVIPCGRGCSACCHGPFDISVADAAVVAAAIAALPEATRRPILVRAAAQLDQMQSLAPDFDHPWDVSTLGEEAFDALCEALADEPCPCLDDTGSCAIYAARPMVCRIMGLGLSSTAGGEIPNACPIQEDFPAYAALHAQPFDLTSWEAREADALATAARELGQAVGFETTVAGAALLQPAPGPP